MAEDKDYRSKMEQEFTRLIDGLQLQDLQKEFLRLRWLDQLMWTEGRAGRTQRKYYRLRLIVIIGGVLIPAVVGLKGVGFIDEVTRWVAFALGLIIAISAAVEEFFNYGERWRHYRRTAEALKTEGWQFFQLSGLYGDSANHEDAYSTFAGRVEQILQQDVEVFVTRIAQEEPKEQQGGGQES